MTPVVIESPYSGDVRENTAYLLDCILDCLNRGEAPFASHLMYTMVLNDNDPDDRKLGIHAGFCWRQAAGAKTVVYTDLGISAGMEAGVVDAVSHGLEVEYRRIR